jgi:hypothetical protein
MYFKKLSTREYFSDFVPLGRAPDFAFRQRPAFKRALVPDALALRLFRPFRFLELVLVPAQSQYTGTAERN